GGSSTDERPGGRKRGRRPAAWLLRSRLRRSLLPSQRQWRRARRRGDRPGPGRRPGLGLTQLQPRLLRQRLLRPPLLRPAAGLLRPAARLSPRLPDHDLLGSLLRRLRRAPPLLVTRTPSPHREEGVFLSDLDLGLSGPWPGRSPG